MRYQKRHGASHKGDGSSHYGNVCAVCGGKIVHTGPDSLVYLTTISPKGTTVTETVRHASCRP